MSDDVPVTGVPAEEKEDKDDEMSDDVPVTGEPAEGKEAEGYETDDEKDKGKLLTQSMCYFGAKQQGMVSRMHGKRYAHPISMKGRRTEQVKRHIANLILNRLKVESSKNPVEIRISTVGKIVDGNGQMKVLLNANNREAEEELFSKIGVEDGGLLAYILGENALKPAMDKDFLRAKRYKAKLESAAKTRKALAATWCS